MRRNEALKEQIQHGEPGYPFALYSNNFFVGNHWHDETELIYIISGTLQISISNTEYCGRAGDIFVVNKNEMHGMYANARGLVYHAFVFDLNMLSFSMGDFSQKQIILPLLEGRIRFFNRPEASCAMEAIFQRILAYNTEKHPGYMLATKGALLEWIGQMIASGQYSAAKADLRDELKTKLLKNIVRYIDSHLHESMTLGEIAAAFNMAPKYFCRFFKKNFKKTLIEYVNSLRIERAALLLREEDDTITEVALSCGFSNISYFTRLFKRMTGYTPSAYKRMLQDHHGSMLSSRF